MQSFSWKAQDKDVYRSPVISYANLEQMSKLTVPVIDADNAFKPEKHEIKFDVKAISLF